MIPDFPIDIRIRLAEFNFFLLLPRAKGNCYKRKKIKKLALNSQLLTLQILSNDVQVLILCLFYFITTVAFKIPKCLY